MSIKFNFNESELNSKLEGLKPKINAAIGMYASTKSVQIKSDMQNNRPWTDRTGMAKLTLNTTVSKPNEDTTRITLAHGVDYGIWLELANEQNYAIIIPTIERESAVIMNDMERFFSKLV